MGLLSGDDLEFGHLIKHIVAKPEKFRKKTKACMSCRRVGGLKIAKCHHRLCHINKIK